MKKISLLLVAFAFAVSCADSRLYSGDSLHTSSEWEAIAFIKSDEFVAKLSEVDSCYESGGAQCGAVLREWSDLCARGAIKYCVGIFEIHKALRKDSKALDKAIATLNKQCSDGEAIACLAIGTFYSTESSALAKKGLAYLQKSCDLGIASGCATTVRFEKNASGAKIYINKAIQIAKKDCRVGQKMACEVVEFYKSMKAEFDGKKGEFK